jgi:two-component system, chemotaxis family, chemotaxis protein CheY
MLCPMSDGLRGPVPGTVLVVDDDADLRDSIEAALLSHGHPVVQAADGAEALAYLKSTNEEPCLVLLDLMMPGMNGFELRSRMNADPALASIPVVVITGAGLLADRRAGELKAEVLRKPIELPTLLRTVRRFCAWLAPRSV